MKGNIRRGRESEKETQFKHLTMGGKANNYLNNLWSCIEKKRQRIQREIFHVKRHGIVNCSQKGREREKIPFVISHACC